MTCNVVIIDDEPITLKRLRRILEKEGCRIAAFSTPQRALQHLEDNPCDLVVSDIQMPGMSGLELMSRARSRFPEIEFILITGYASFDGAVDATKEGAFYYLAKPFTPDQLRERVEQALAQITVRAAARNAAAQGARLDAPVIIGKSLGIQQVETQIRQVAETDINVLITGASGTGKELVARCLHALSNRAKGPFLAFNCGAMTESLIDNELFGHEKGAYTGAEKSAPGLVETASGGTLFLDEIGEMPQAMQVKLLRVLQEKELIRVGGRSPVSLDVRVVSATSKDLKAAVAEGTMRSDFFFRINVFNIHLPPLNERLDDIPVLAEHFNQQICGEYGIPPMTITDDAIEEFKKINWTGNIREFRNVLERLVILCDQQIEGKDVKAFAMPISK